MSIVGEPIHLTTIEGKGRALISTRQLKAGEIILKESPILIYSALPFISKNPNASYCHNCFKLITNQLKTTTCDSTSSHVFCNPNCLSIALASSHPPSVCHALNQLQHNPNLSFQNEEVQIQAKFLIAAYNLAIRSPSEFRILLSLQGEARDWLWNEELEFLHSVVMSLCPDVARLASQEMTAALLAKDKMNAFGLMEPFGVERSVRGYALYGKASFFNHDCLPNVCRFDYLDGGFGGNEGSTDIVIRVIHDVPQGRELCLSYFPVNERYALRQKRLLEDYGFKCECDRCKVEASWSEDECDSEMEAEDEAMDDDDEQDDDQMDAADDDGNCNDFPHAYFFLRYMCDKENCGGTLAPLPPSIDGRSSAIMECNVCGNLKPDEQAGCSN